MTALQVIGAVVVLAAAGAVPVVALVGVRPLALPLLPLGGAVLAALGVTVGLAVGGTSMAWFAGLSVVAALGGASWIWWRPAARRPGTGRPRLPRALRLVRLVAAAGVVAAVAWELRTLATPTVGFDTRANWLMRAGWFLEPHARLLHDLRTDAIHLPQTAYPPLVSAVGAVSWAVSGTHSARVGVATIAVVNACALAAAAYAVAEAGIRAAARAADGRGAATTGWLSARGASPAVFGAAAAVLLVFVAFSVTEPFFTNGYADPLWSLAVVGAAAYGLQLDAGRFDLAVAGLLVVVAGMTKDEGAATAAIVIVLLVARWWWRTPAPARRQRVLGLASGALGLILVGAWPLLMRLISARGLSPGGPRQGSYLLRAHQAADGLVPHLHVILLAVPVAAAGALFLVGARRTAGLAHDGWGWAALLAALAVIEGAYVTGTASVPLWLLTTSHRVTECVALMAWWIVAVWGVAAATGWAAPGVVAPARHAARARGARSPVAVPSAVAPARGSPVSSPD